MKLLVVDVESEVRDQIQVGLEAFEGFSVECARGGAALDRVRRCNYDGIFLGVTAKGNDQLRRITEDQPDLPIVVLGDDAVLRRVKQENPSVLGLLAMPLDAMDFYRTVARLSHRLGATS